MWCFLSSMEEDVICCYCRNELHELLHLPWSHATLTILPCRNWPLDRSIDRSIYRSIDRSIDSAIDSSIGRCVDSYVDSLMDMLSIPDGPYRLSQDMELTWHDMRVAAIPRTSSSIIPMKATRPPWTVPTPCVLAKKNTAMAELRTEKWRGMMFFIGRDKSGYAQIISNINTSLDHFFFGTWLHKYNQVHL